MFSTAAMAGWTCSTSRPISTRSCGFWPRGWSSTKWICCTVPELPAANHWHLVLRPGRGEELGRLMGWVCVTHVRRHHAHYHSAGGGHLYQGRFKSFPVQDDRHFLVLCRYVPSQSGPGRACEQRPGLALEQPARPLRQAAGVADGRLAGRASGGIGWRWWIVRCKSPTPKRCGRA